MTNATVHYTNLPMMALAITSSLMATETGSISPEPALSPDSQRQADSLFPEYDNTLTRYQVSSDDRVTAQVEAIQQFASNLLDNVQDLDPEFSRLIDEHFDELV